MENKGKIFGYYNKAMAAVRRGQLPEAETRKALAVLMSKDGASHLEKYHTTTNACSCPAHRYNSNKPCKHMIAKMIIFRVNEKPVAAPKREATLVQTMPASRKYKVSPVVSRTTEIEVGWNGTKDELLALRKRDQFDAQEDDCRFRNTGDANGFYALLGAGFKPVSAEYIHSARAGKWYGMYKVTLSKKVGE